MIISRSTTKFHFCKNFPVQSPVCSFAVCDFKRRIVYQSRDHRYTIYDHQWHTITHHLLISWVIHYPSIYHQISDRPLPFHRHQRYEPIQSNIQHHHQHHP